MKLFHPLLALIASSTETELARQVRYLKEENRILRDRIPGEIHTRLEERARLLKFGRKLGHSINELITIVTPGTFRRWLREENKEKKKVGRPRTSEVLRELVRKIAKETGSGSKKILGELRRLGITRLCRQTVRSLVKEEGIGPSPKRSGRTWDEFLTPGKFETHRHNQVQLTTSVNARCESLIQTIRQECLNHFIIFGHKHLDYLLSRFMEHYNKRRAHSSLSFQPPACNDPPPENNEINLEEIVCHQDLGGVIKSYERRAA